MEIFFRNMIADDWEKVAEIYRQGIETGNATFEQKIPSWEVWNQAHLENCRILACSGSELAGWAALSPVSSRCVYAGVAEVSVYVSNNYKGRKVGFRLLEQLILQSEKSGIWTLQAGFFPENIASISIHKALGFREIGFHEKIGKINDTWRDTILLERRSKTIGIR
jgi:L-amino acid N-acyltransferase YncA